MPRILFSLLLALGLGGCAAISALDHAATPQDVHELRGPLNIPVAATASRLHLSVEPPAASGAVAIDRILVREGPTQVSYLPEARWSAAAPDMLQTTIVQTLLRANAFAFVGRRPLGTSGDLVLVTTLLDFEADATQGDANATVRMTLVARLVSDRDARVVASRTFTQSVPLPDTTDGAILSGYRAVTDAVLTDLTRWVIAESR